MNTTIEIGAYVRTDRFCTVTIDAIFADNEDDVKYVYGVFLSAVPENIPEIITMYYFYYSNSPRK